MWSIHPECMCTVQINVLRLTFLPSSSDQQVIHVLLVAPARSLRIKLHATFVTQCVFISCFLSQSFLLLG